MRVYHFINDEYGRKAIERRRLKIAQLDNLNDPFELFAYSLGDKKRRQPFYDWKKEISGRYGILCFCKTWRNPLMWSHYADHHRGLCLGFDVADELLMPVDYQESRIKIFPDALDEDLLKQLLSRKYKGWAYEEEQRVCTRLEHPDFGSGLYFEDFNEKMALKEVVVGPLNSMGRVSLGAKIKAAGLPLDDIRLSKARLGLKRYDIVPDKRGLR